MSLRIALKLGLIGVLVIVLLIPLGLLGALVSERQQRGAEVAEQIAASSSRAQLLIGPLLIVESSRGVQRETIVTENGQMRRVAETVREYDTRVIAPADLAVDGTLTTEQRSRGVFTALLYHGAQQLDGHFRVPALAPPEGGVVDQRIERITLALGVGDTRGIRALTLKIDGREREPQPGSALGWLPEGVHAVLYAADAPADAAGAAAPVGRDLAFDIDLQLSGTESIGWVPLGDQNRISVAADWPHPGFFGNYLPERKEITEQGFAAEWRVSRLSSNAQQALAQCSAGSCGVAASGFTVRFVEPVDRYLMTDRAMKYSLLFVLLIFGAVFFIEALKRIDVHPLQYALTGLALAMFYLLLLSLAEHIGFGLAYLAAATACVALIATYMSAVLGGAARGIAFAGLLAALYGLLYGLLRSEDYALLMGALALFGLLATVMVLTRRLDWNTVGRLRTAGAEG